MWFRVAGGAYMRSSDVVGFFGPDAAPGPDGGPAGRGAVLMRDGRVVPVPFGPGVMAARMAGAAAKQGIPTDGAK